ncbi:MAG: 3-dehydroquinate synthase, partial [Moraxellaceae bacterium]
ALLGARFNRDCTVLALGGGVVGDMAGFAAASFQRGVDFVQVPTTLLSQVDSSVGGKTGINHALGKNMIGAFKQPNVVMADMAQLDTLPDRELSAGLAEVIKYALLGDIEFLGWLELHMRQLVARDAQLLAEAVYRSCLHKAKIVAADEHEHGDRALLNLGHTFGHAIESYLGYGEWLHGEAVAAGMVMAADLSHRVGWISHADVERVRRILQQANLPVTCPDIPVEKFLALMAQDKKVLAGQLRLVLLKQLGQAVITRDVDIRQVEQTILACQQAQESLI